MDRKLIKEYYQEVYRQGHEVLEEATKSYSESGSIKWVRDNWNNKNKIAAYNKKLKAEIAKGDKSDYSEYERRSMEMLSSDINAGKKPGEKPGDSKVAKSSISKDKREKAFAAIERNKGNEDQLKKYEEYFIAAVKKNAYDEEGMAFIKTALSKVQVHLKNLGGGSGDDSAVAGKGGEKDIYYYPGDKKYEYKLVKVGDKWQWHASVRGKNKWKDVTKYVGSKLDKKAKNKDGEGPPVKVGGGSRSYSKKPKTGFKPKVGQEIEAKWEGSWHDAKVVSVEGDTVEVKWPGYKGTNKVPVSDTRARVTDSGLGRDPENFANYTMNTFPKIADQYAGAPSKMTFTRTSNRKGTPLYRSKESWEISGAMGAKVLGIAVIQGQGENARILVQQNTVGGKPPKKEWQTLNVGMSYEDIDQARLGESFIRPTKNILKEIILQEMLKGN
jgi:hypothetical protein